MSQYLIQLLVPLQDNEGRRFDRAAFDRVSAELSERFGGATAYIRSPARGLWEKDDGRKSDDIVVIEAMSETLDEDWWRTYRRKLEKRFRQEEMVIRSQAIRIL